MATLTAFFHWMGHQSLGVQILVVAGGGLYAWWLFRGRNA